MTYKIARENARRHLLVWRFRVRERSSYLRDHPPLFEHTLSRRHFSDRNMRGIEYSSLAIDIGERLKSRRYYSVRLPDIAATSPPASVVFFVYCYFGPKAKHGHRLPRFNIFVHKDTGKVNEIVVDNEYRIDQFYWGGGRAFLTSTDFLT